MARIRKGRSISGIIVLNKPLGITSTKVLSKVKNLLQANKAGHTGALDPMASGVLPLCFGEATKFSQVLLESTKAYITTCKLGETRTTGDQEGELIETFVVPSSDKLEPQALETLLNNFRGEISQVPPMYSALKHNGRPLYKLAREGKELDLSEIKKRQVTIHKLEVLAIREDEIDLAVTCSKGTYIRSLVQDIGEALGSGAYVSMLHRTAAGPFNESDMVSLEQLEQILEQDGMDVLDQQLLHASKAIEDWPSLELNVAQGKNIMFGQTAKTSEKPQPQVQLWVRVGDQLDFIGIGEIGADGTVTSKRLFRLDFSHWG